MARLLVTLDGRAEAGGTPLLCHNERLADPLDPITMEIAKLSGQRKKTEAIYLDMARLEFVGGLYFDEGLGPCVPSWNIIRCTQEGGKRFKLGADVLRAVVPTTELVPIQYDGPREIDAMWEDGRFISRKGVGISGRRVIRTRPSFTDWMVEAEVELDLDVMTPEKIEQCVVAAGKYAGLGDNRTGGFGRFRGSAALVPVPKRKKAEAVAA